MPPAFLERHHECRHTQSAAKFLAADAHVDALAVQPLPNSRKIYVQGSQPDIRVPMREISQADTPDRTSAPVKRTRPFSSTTPPGPYTDPAANIDIRTGLPALAHAAGSRRAATPNCWPT